MTTKTKNLFYIFIVFIGIIFILIFQKQYIEQKQIDTVNNQDKVFAQKEVTEIEDKSIIETYTEHELDIDSVVSKIKPEYKQLPDFKRCLGADIGIKSCLRDAVNKKIEKSNDVKFCDDLIFDTKSCKNDFYTKKAIESINPKLCEKVEGDYGYCLSEVYTKQALKENNPEICEKIKNIDQKYSCRATIITKQAIDTNSIDLCDNLLRLLSVGKDDERIEYTEDIDIMFCKEEFQRNAGKIDLAPGQQETLDISIDGMPSNKETADPTKEEVETEELTEKNEI